MKQDKRNITTEEICELGQSAIGKTFREYCQDQSINYKSKGSLGSIIEKGLFEIEANTDKGPDFTKAGIELKVTPFIKNKNKTLSAKERLVLGIINYNTEYYKTFEESDYWQKDAKLFLMFYEYIKDVDSLDLYIRHTMLLQYSDKDLQIIKNDWQTIRDKIRGGKAHELSEADTMYLGACPKGANKKSLRSQPFSEVKAMQRAYCLKQSFMTTIVRANLGKDKLETLVNEKELYSKSFEQILMDKLSPYQGKTIEDLIQLFRIEEMSKNNSKSINDSIVSRMFGIKGKINKTEEFQKANMISKTVRVNENDSVIESMSFPSFKYTEIVKEEWETSKLRIMFLETKFMFVIFRKYMNTYRFEKIVFWNMPNSILETNVKDVWLKTKKTIQEGKIVLPVSEQKNGKKTYFPGMTDDSVCHVRPHATKNERFLPLPVPDILTRQISYKKHCFWLKNTFIAKIIF